MKGMSVPIGHHVLPEKAHLDGFTVDGLLWVFDRVTRKFHHLHPSVTTVRNNYYSFIDRLGNKDTRIENPVLSGIEGATIPVIQKLEKREQITLDDRMVLSLFVALMHLCTPAFEKMHNALGDQLHKWRNKQLFNSLEQVQTLMNSFPAGVMSKGGPTAKEVFEFVQQSDYKVTFHRNASLELMLELAIELTPVLAGLKWIVGHSPANNSFLTTDAPFVISEPPDWNPKLGSGQGILVRGSTKAIMLSQRLCLSMGDPGEFFAHLDLDETAVRRNNLAFASRSQRFLIASNEQLIKEVVTSLGWDKGV